MKKVLKEKGNIRIENNLADFTSLHNDVYVAVSYIFYISLSMMYALILRGNIQRVENNPHFLYGFGLDICYCFFMIII